MIVKSFDGHNINDTTSYKALLTESAYGLPSVETIMTSRQRMWPVISGLNRAGREIYVRIFPNTHGDPFSLHTQLQQWLTPEDETPKTLLAANDDGDDVYIMAICTNLQELQGAVGLEYLATFKVSGDIRWTKVAQTSDTWNITASGQTRTITNGGNEFAYPIIRIKPTSNHGGTPYQFRRWIPLRWNSDFGAVNYPTDICNAGFNTAAEVAAGQMQADGDDLRVWVNGKEEVNRWLSGMNGANTKVWINLDFQAEVNCALKTAIAGAGAITTIDLTVTEIGRELAAFPWAGIVIIGTEAFSYTGKDFSTSQLTGVTRTVNGTSIGAHSIGDTVWVVQHDVWIVYGNASVSAPATDDTFKPIIALTSTNIIWTYAEFYNVATGTQKFRPRAGSWEKESVGNASFYGGNEGAAAEPAVELGIQVTRDISSNAPARLKLNNPCGFISGNFTNGEKHMTTGGLAGGDWYARVQSLTYSGSNWIDEYTITKPSADNAWQAWSQNVTFSVSLISGQPKSIALALAFGFTTVPTTFSLECADAAITLDSAHTPTLTIGPEQLDPYRLQATISTDRSTDTISLDVTMNLNQTLEVNTLDKTVTLIDDSTNQFQALTPNTIRRDWFKLWPGANIWTYTETDAAGLTITTLYNQRFF